MKRTTKKLLPIILLITVTVFSMIMFTGCLDADPTVQVDKLQSTYNYSVSNEDFSGVNGYEGCINRVKAEYGVFANIDYKYVYILYFSSETYAARYYENIFKPYSVPEFEEQNPVLSQDFVHHRYGKIVIYGTADGVKDATN